jgi:hypothetical protein
MFCTYTIYVYVPDERYTSEQEEATAKLLSPQSLYSTSDSGVGYPPPPCFSMSQFRLKSTLLKNFMY